MRYLRTKNGRIVDLHRTVQGDRLIHLDDEYHVAGWYWEIVNEAECYDWEIIKQSDSIEELCDKFVWIDNDYSRGFIGNIEFAKNCTKLHEGRLYGDSKFIFGAIWTDKGLIYVAKMNYKGELVLI